VRLPPGARRSKTKLIGRTAMFDIILVLILIYIAFRIDASNRRAAEKLTEKINGR
jgi:hypothetical protein